jgi:DNA-binding response OmpR family regulator
MPLSKASAQKTPSPQVQAACLSVVVVEDHDDLRDVVVDVIASHGHHVVGLDCAEDMEDTVGARPIDILVVDLNLPGEDGLSLARRFRTAQPLSGVIIMSARHTVDDKVKGYNCGADVYLQKPISTDELMAAINSISRRLLSQAPVINQAKPKNFSLDTEKMLMSGPLGKVGLTDAETILLTSLARAPGQRLEFKQLMEILNLEDSSLSKSAFEVRMVRLRKKMISTGADKLCIRAIRLQGYQLGTVLKIA